MKRVSRLNRKWLVRIFIVLAIAGAVVYRINSQTSSIIQTDEAYAQSHLTMASNTVKALETYNNAFNNLKSPSNIQPQDTDLPKNYVQSVLDSYQKISGTVAPNQPRLLSDSSSKDIKRYMKLAKDPLYTPALGKASSALQQDASFFGYHYSVMKALSGFLGYVPDPDLNDTNQSDKLAVTTAGLQTTLDKLRSAPTYDDDSLQNILEQINQDKQAGLDLQNQYAQSVSPLEAQKASYISKVKSAQLEVIKNRAAFWETQKAKLSGQTSEALQKYKPFLQNL
jgi:hypothetical protein